MYIKTDLTGIKIHNMKRLSSNKIQESMHRFSTGLRINSAKDNTAGLQISERLKSQITESRVKQQNIARTQDAAKGVMDFYNGVLDQLQRLRELQVQYNNGTYQSTDKISIHNEMKEIMSNIEQTRRNFTFNDIKLFESLGLNFNNIQGTTIPYGQGINPVAEPHTFTMWVKTEYTGNAQKMIFSHSGTNSNRIYISLTFGKWSTGIQATHGGSGDINSAGSISNNTEWTHLALAMDGSEAKLYVNGDLSSTRNYTDFVTSSDFGLGFISVVPAQNFVGQIDDVRIYNRELSETEISLDKGGMLLNDVVGSWNFENTDNVMEDSTNNGLDGTNLYATSIGGSGTVMKLDDNHSFKIGSLDNSTLKLENFNPNNPDALNKIDSAINWVLKATSNIGSVYNRMEYKKINQETKEQNLSLSNQRIEESNVLLETSELAKGQVKLQTAIQMLRQNNSNRENALGLLQS